jgi:hypothetical protein
MFRDEMDSFQTHYNKQVLSDTNYRIDESRSCNNYPPQNNYKSLAPNALS